MFAVESCEETLEIAQSLLAPDKWSQISFDAVVTHVFWTLVGRPQGLRRSIDTLIRQHRLQHFTQTSRGRFRQKGFEGLGGPVVMGITVGEREAADALRVHCGENLCNTPAAVVADEIY